MREKVAWRSETWASTARAASARMASPRSSDRQQGQVVAPAQAGHPGRLERSWYMPVGPLPPPLGQLLEAGVGLGRAGGDGGHLVQAHVLDGGGLSAVGGGELARSSAAWAATWPARWENSAIRASGTPATSKRARAEWRRSRSSQPKPRAAVKRSASAPS